MTIRCSNCGQESTRCFAAKDWNRRISEETFVYYICPQCKLVFLHPVPEDLDRYYPTNYYAIPESVEQLALASGADRYKLGILGAFRRDGRLLEIGAAYGSFAYLAKKAGYEVETLEMDARCCEFLESVVGVHVIHDHNIAAGIASRPSYDVIALWHVIEHLRDPWGALQAISEKVRPDGILAIAAPNPEALQFRMLGRHWAHVDAPRHVVLIPHRILEERMARLGMETVLCTTTDEGTLGWNTFGWQVSLSNIASQKTLKWFLSAGGYVIGKIMAPLERRDRLGSAYTIVFRKKSSS